MEWEEKVVWQVKVVGPFDKRGLSFIVVILGRWKGRIALCGWNKIRVAVLGFGCCERRFLA